MLTSCLVLLTSDVRGLLFNFTEFCAKTQGEQNRTSEVADLSKLDTTVSRINEAKDDEIKLRTSTSSM